MAIIYISSTYVDLKKEREAAAQAVRRLGHQSVYMEDYVAAPQFPVDKCLQDVGGCDVYIGIFAWRYGFIPDGYDKSITHLEYETAQKNGIPCLIFLTDKKAPLTIEYVDTGEERQKIDGLRKELMNEYIVSFFKNADELSGKVSSAVSNLISMAERSFIKFKRPEELIGTKLGKYIIREKLGRGGKGVVFKVMDTLEDREKAIKMVPPRVADSPVAFKELKREVNTAACIIHPNVVKVLALEEQEGQYFIVMEYIEGKSLEQKLAESKEGKLKETEVIAIMQKLARGLLETHKNKVIHRDIKPSNVMVTPDGQVKILDFGVSYQVTKSMTEMVGEHQSMGTWPYMAPEQLRTKYGRENQQVDIWGFGVTMYQLLTGQFPFINKDQIKDEREKPYEMAGVSRKTRNLVMKCLEKDRKKRFQNMEQVLNALHSISKRKVIAKPKPKQIPKPKKNTLMKWSLAAAAIIVLIVLSVILKNLIDRSMPGDKLPGTEKKTVTTEVPDKKTGTGEKQGGDSKEKDEERFTKLLEKARECLGNGDFKNARENLKQAEKFKKTKDAENIGNDINRKEFDYYFSKAKDYYIKEKYNDALKFISKAEKIKITDDLKDLKKKTLERLDEQRKQELIAQDERAYEKAAAQNTIPAYQAYLGKYKNGRHTSEAEEKIRELKEKQKPDYVTAVEEIAKKVYKNDKGYWEAEYDDEIIMVYIPPVKFTMGSKDYSDEKPPHTVYLDGYWIGKYEVTFSQYDRYCDETGKKKPDDRGWGRGKHPVIYVSWDDADAYCQWLSKKTGLTFKLPTEAQWEKAARGTDNRKYPWGNNGPDEKLANYASKVGKTSPVGSYLQGASPYGLLDMAGNVWEWCQDLYDENYYKSSSDTPDKNPTGPKGGPSRVMRGGGWSLRAVALRCANRDYGYPSYRYSVGPSDRGSDVGFRLRQDN